MKILWIALLVLVPVAAQAASLEQAYLAARDAHIRKIAAADKAGLDSDRLSKLQDDALADLQKQLRQVVGPTALKVPGIPAEPKLNYDTLLQSDQGFGMLDGLTYASDDYKSLVVVTTEGLFKAWLRDHRKWWKDSNVPQDPTKALAHNSFYTQSTSADSAVSKYAELPIRKPGAASLAFAMLSGRAQDIGPWDPEDVVVSVLQGGKLYVVREPASVKLGPFLPCQAVWDEAAKKAEAAFERERESPDAKTGDQIRDEGDAAFHRCFAERAPQDKGFADLVRQAQAIADGLPK